jgi:hypothetical protein
VDSRSDLKNSSCMNLQAFGFIFFELSQIETLHIIRNSSTMFSAAGLFLKNPGNRAPLKIAGS